MKKNNIHLWAIILLIPAVLGCSLPTETPPATPFITAEGRLLKKGGEPILLQGICFSNYYYHPGLDLTTSKHHQEIDFQRVRDMGMNVIRFALNADFFESSPGVFKDSVFQWLDTRVLWAEKYGVYLILDMHIPIGGEWLSAVDPTDFTIWTDPAVRKRNIDLWKAIAERYKDNPWIAAYNILNEPITIDTTGDSWKSYIQETITAIRSVDKNHLLIIERLYGTNGKFEYPPGTELQFLVDDDNVMYDFHFYEPSDFTHQNAHWVENPRDGGIYPDPDYYQILDWDTAVLKGLAESNASATGTTDWTYYDGPLVHVTDPAIIVGAPNVLVKGNNTGTVYFDKLIIKEYDADGTFIQDILVDDITSKTVTEWYVWSEGGESAAGNSTRVTTGGYNDNYCLKISGTSANTGWSNGYKLVKITTGNKYQICGYMKTEDLPASVNAAFSLVFYSDPDGKTIVPRDKEFLRILILQWMEFGVNNNVPISMTEFGTINTTFQNNKGGLAWVADVLDLAIEYNLHFTYWQYHSDAMGIYYGDSTDNLYPSQANANTVLIDLFSNKLASGP